MKNILLLFIIILIVGCASKELPITDEPVVSDKVIVEEPGFPSEKPSEPFTDIPTSEEIEKAPNITEPTLESPKDIDDMVEIEIMQDLHIEPKEVNITVGQMIKLTNKGSAAQIFLAKPVPYDSKKLVRLDRLLSGDSLNFSLKKGTYVFYGTGFPSIQSTIIVS